MGISELPLGAIALSVLVAGLAYGVGRLYQERSRYRNLPKPPHSFFWGHLKLLGMTFRQLPNDVHYQTAVTTIANKYNMPGLFYLDLWPASSGQVVVTDPDVAMHLTVTRNHPKHEAEKFFIDPLIGPDNIVSADGPRWKHLHKMLSPAFAIKHISEMRPMVASEAMKFRSILMKKAESGDKFRFEDLTLHLTFDVIGTATFGRSLEAQTKGTDALVHFEAMTRAFMKTRESFNFITNFYYNRIRNAERAKLDAIVAELIKERWGIVKRDNLDLKDRRGLGIMDLILRDYMAESSFSEKQELDSEFLANAITQVKTLLVAGTGTSSDTLCFTMMLLSKHPAVVEKMRLEHDSIFGRGTDATYEKLCGNPYKLNELVYTTNVIKEVLRFYPIGNTARAGIDTLHYEGQNYPTKDLMICPVQHTMHLNPKIFPNAGIFDPDRFEREDFPRHAWRPFERGPRACLGQPLAMDELKLTLLIITRDFDFACADLKPNAAPRVSWTDMDTIYGDRFFQEFVFEARPRDGMPMTIKQSSWPQK